MKNKKITLPMIGLGMLVWHVIHVICISQIDWVRKMYEKLFVLIPSNLLSSLLTLCILLYFIVLTVLILSPLLRYTLPRVGVGMLLIDLMYMYCIFNIRWVSILLTNILEPIPMPVRFFTFFIYLLIAVFFIFSPVLKNKLIWIGLGMMVVQSIFLWGIFSLAPWSEMFALPFLFYIVYFCTTKLLLAVGSIKELRKHSRSGKMSD